MCYNARQENAITYITQKNIQGGNPLYAKFKKKKIKNSIYIPLRLRNE